MFVVERVSKCPSVKVSPTNPEATKQANLTPSRVYNNLPNEHLNLSSGITRQLYSNLLQPAFFDILTNHPISVEKRDILYALECVVTHWSHLVVDLLRGVSSKW